MKNGTVPSTWAQFQRYSHHFLVSIGNKNFIGGQKKYKRRCVWTCTGGKIKKTIIVTSFKFVPSCISVSNLDLASFFSCNLRILEPINWLVEH